MRKCACRFGEQQAAPRVAQFDASSARVLGDRGIISIGVVSVERELETAFTCQRTMTSAGVATGFRENRDNVSTEFRFAFFVYAWIGLNPRILQKKEVVLFLSSAPEDRKRS